MRAGARRSWALISTVLVAATLAVPVAALPFPGGDVRYSGPNATDNEFNPAVAYNPVAGEYLVVWQDARNLDTRGYDIFAQRVGEDGARIGPNIRVSDSAAIVGEYTPDVAFSVTSNQYLVVWSDGRDDPAMGYEIFGQRIRSGGNKAGGNFRISDANAVADEYSPAVAWNSNGNQYLVVWEDTRLDPDAPTPTWDIYGQRIRGGGRKAGGNFRISGPFGAPALGREIEPAVAFSAAANKYLVVWADSRYGATHGMDVYGARIRPSGLVADADIVISGIAADDDETWPDVAWNPNANQFLVVWTDTRNAPARGNDIYARRVKGGGAMAGLDFRVSDAYALETEGDAAVAFSPDENRYLVVWTDYRDAWTEGLNIYAQRVKAGGATPGVNFLVTGVPTDAQEGSADVAFGSGGPFHLVIWTDSRNSATRGGDVYGRLVTD